MDCAGGGPELTSDQLDDGGLTGAGGADEEAKLAVLNLHGHAVQRFITLLIGFYNISKLNHMYNLL